MIIRAKDNWKIWRDCAPSSAACDHGHNCDCTYHVAEDGFSESYGFHSFKEAEDKFCKMSGATKFVFGKTNWN